MRRTVPIGIPGGRAPCFEDLVREARRVRLSVAIVNDWEHARVIAEAFVEEDRIGPGSLSPADREVGCTVADDNLTSGILDALFRAPDVSSELIGRLPPDVFVSIAVAANLVALCRDPSD